MTIHWDPYGDLDDPGPRTRPCPRCRAWGTVDGRTCPRCLGHCDDVDRGAARATRADLDDDHDRWCGWYEDVKWRARLADAIDRRDGQAIVDLIRTYGTHRTATREDLLSSARRLVAAARAAHPPGRQLLWRGSAATWAGLLEAVELRGVDDPGHLHEPAHRLIGVDFYESSYNLPDGELLLGPDGLVDADPAGFYLLTLPWAATGPCACQPCDPDCFASPPWRLTRGDTAHPDLMFWACADGRHETAFFRQANGCIKVYRPDGRLLLREEPGPLHDDLEQIVERLQSAGLVDADGRWAPAPELVREGWRWAVRHAVDARMELVLRGLDRVVRLGALPWRHAAEAAHRDGALPPGPREYLRLRPEHTIAWVQGDDDPYRAVLLEHYPEHR